jgi:hypothetical protein
MCQVFSGALIHEPPTVSQVQGRVGSAMVAHAGRTMTLKIAAGGGPKGRFFQMQQG